MSRATSDDQLRFLLSCVKHANNGKIDFSTVSIECGIVSKGAAAKRFERLMKANNIYQSSSEKLSSRILKSNPKVSKAKMADMKQRKAKDHVIDVVDEIEPLGSSYVHRLETCRSPHVKLESHSNHKFLSSKPTSASKPLCCYRPVADVEAQPEHDQPLPELSKIPNHTRISPTLSSYSFQRGSLKNVQYGVADEVIGSATIKHEAEAYQTLGEFVSQDISEHLDVGENRNFSIDPLHETNHTDIDRGATLPQHIEGLGLQIKKEVLNSSVITRTVEDGDPSCVAMESKFGNKFPVAHSSEYLPRFADRNNEFTLSKRAVPETKTDTDIMKTAKRCYIRILD